jgi:hypothetical protein
MTFRTTDVESTTLWRPVVGDFVRFWHGERDRLGTVETIELGWARIMPVTGPRSVVAIQVQDVRPASFQLIQALGMTDPRSPQ